MPLNQKNEITGDCLETILGKCSSNGYKSINVATELYPEAIAYVVMGQISCSNTSFTPVAVALTEGVAKKSRDWQSDNCRGDSYTVMRMPVRCLQVGGKFKDPSGKPYLVTGENFISLEFMFNGCVTAAQVKHQSRLGYKK